MNPIITPAQDSANENSRSSEEDVAVYADRTLVDTVRQTARALVAIGTQDACGLALSLIDEHWRHLHAVCPLTEDLRAWQLLASDLSVALEGSQVVLAQRAVALAEGIRETIATMARNPIGQLALRPGSRRVLNALHGLGGKAGISRVRDASRHTPAHFATVLKALQGHGFVTIETSCEDYRCKTLSLTRMGRTEIVRSMVSGQPNASFESDIRVNRSVPTGASYL